MDSLSISQLKLASEVATRAFYDEPLTVNVLPEQSQRGRVLPLYYQVILRYGIMYGKAFVTSPNLEGIAVWLPPEESDIPMWKVLLAGAWWLPFKVKPAVFIRYIPLARASCEMHERHAPFPHWYLLLLCVAPEQQGNGYASTLLRTMLARIDAEHSQCYLEIGEEKNIHFYEHYGFKVVGVSKVKDTNVSIWAMIRGRAP